MACAQLDNNLMSAFAMLGILFLLLCVLLDLFSLYFEISRIRGDHAPSGVPLISWFFYAIFSAMAKSLSIFVVLTIFHICCHFLIPWLYSRWRSRVSGKNGNSL